MIKSIFRHILLGVVLLSFFTGTNEGLIITLLLSLMYLALEAFGEWMNGRQERAASFGR